MHVSTYMHVIKVIRIIDNLKPLQNACQLYACTYKHFYVLIFWFTQLFSPSSHSLTYSLLDICNYPNRSDLMRLMITTLDFAHDVHSRVILNKLLTATHKEMRLYSTQHMRVLLRAKMPFFNSWGLELLLPQVGLW